MKTITKKAYGKNIKITDARDNFSLAINNAYGNTEQDGEPTPDVPIEIKSVVLSEIKTTNLDGTLESVATLSEPIAMNGLNGVWDTLESKKFKTVVFDGSDDEGWTAVITKVDGKYRNSTNLLKGIAKPFDIADVANLLCTHYKAIPSNTEGTWGANQGMCIDGTATLMVYDDNYNTSDISLWKAHLASNPMEVTYELAEPIETPLPDADVEALKSLKTYDGVTHISTDSEVEPTLEVEYTLLEAKDEWNYTDYILHTDYNRIVGNINYLKAYLDSLFLGLTNISTMEEKTATSLIYAREINSIETALETLNLETYGFDIGETKEYLPNTRTLDFVELNRIESAILLLYKTMTAQKEALPKLAFTLGGQKGFKV